MNNENKVRDTAEKIFKSKYDELTKQEKHVAHPITERTPISTNISKDISEQVTFGQRLADNVASLDFHFNIHECADYLDYTEFVHPCKN